MWLKDQRSSRRISRGTRTAQELLVLSTYATYSILHLEEQVMHAEHDVATRSHED